MLINKLTITKSEHTWRLIYYSKFASKTTLERSKNSKKEMTRFVANFDFQLNLFRVSINLQPVGHVDVLTRPPENVSFDELAIYLLLNALILA